MLDVIAFDADDTLWYSESLYARTQQQFVDLLTGYHPEEKIMRVLYGTEMKNLELYGYGVKSFALSMIETAIALSDGRVLGREVLQIIDLAKGMLEAPVELLEGVEGVVLALASLCRLMLITKGDLRDQERKLATSGLSPHFSCVEIVSEKTANVYQSLLAKHSIAADRFLMVGNSLRSDVMPVVALGGHAVHVPYHITWAHENVPAPEPRKYVELAHIGLLPAHIEGMCRNPEV